MDNSIIVREATEADAYFAEIITHEMAESAKARGTGIAKRSPDYIREKMKEGKAVIAVTATGEWIGFCYIESWEHEKFVANSGLIVSPAFRKTGVATHIKRKVFDLSRKKYPHAKIFGLTTGLAVMKINSDLGYEPVTYSQLTSDDNFWKGCQSCVNYEILMSKDRKNCMCTAMLYDPEEKAKEAAEKKTHEAKPENFWGRSLRGDNRVFERWVKFKQFVLLKGWRKKDESNDTKKSSFFSFLFW
ncbi:MAG: N-succinyl-L-citrulline:glutamate succinyltransferase [Cytophagales bacterium]|nr:GNAT family N-acetyltransferase [Bacteroidota bacterium]MBS1980107.1 GNAT family N-acetyltransferase [Bacteroidota bacterium]WHZ08614.1 MAG: N-succinyl-L-citrulline:glutamate succinyltransferase [Cytophagales bacterium]